MIFHSHQVLSREVAPCPSKTIEFESLFCILHNVKSIVLARIILLIIIVVIIVVVIVIIKVVVKWHYGAIIY